MNSGQYTSATNSTTVDVNGQKAMLQGSTFSGAPCSKAPPAFPAPCSSFAPAITLEAARVKFNGKSPIVDKTPQISMTNAIPAFTYTSVSSTVKVL